MDYRDFDFTGPQSFNVEIGPEAERQVTPHVVRPLANRAVDGDCPVLFEKDVDLYPRRRHGVIRRR